MFDIGSMCTGAASSPSKRISPSCSSPCARVHRSPAKVALSRRVQKALAFDRLGLHPGRHPARGVVGRAHSTSFVSSFVVVVVINHCVVGKPRILALRMLSSLAPSPSPRLRPFSGTPPRPHCSRDRRIAPPRQHFAHRAGPVCPTAVRDRPRRSAAATDARDAAASASRSAVACSMAVAPTTLKCVVDADAVFKVGSRDPRVVCVTIPEVLDEIRDARGRAPRGGEATLSTSAFCEASMDAVRPLASKTGRRAVES